MRRSEPRVGQLSLFAVQERLTERDRQLLAHVGALRLLGARQIQTLVFPDEQHATPGTAARTCRRVLERMTRDRLLVRLERRIGGVRSGSASFIYTLGALGQRALDLEDPRRRLAEPSARFVDHTLAIADFFVDLVVHARAGGCELLEWQSEPQCWREVVTLGGRVDLRPDLFVVVAVGDYELRWFIEIDRGSEHLPAITRKCRLYHSHYKTGQEQRLHKVFPRILLVVPNQRRLERLQALIAADRRLTGNLFRVTTNERALGAIGERE